MTELKIDRQQLLKLRSESHALNPMVLLGQNGLTDTRPWESARRSIPMAS